MVRRTALCLLLLLAVAACSQSSTEADGTPDVENGTEVFFISADTNRDAPRQSETLSDRGTAEAALFVECDPGDGCFGDKCTDNSQCDSGWCIEHMGEGVCTAACVEDCPHGWSCTQVPWAAPDVLFVCLSAYETLCKPCSSSDDCLGPGGTPGVFCVSYGPGGSFCGGACGQDDECPQGYSCQQVETTEQATLQQCIADAGECTCTDKSIAMHLATPCEASNEFGACSGERTCLEDGLSPCDAATPAEETCNTVDDDCDGELNEDTCADDNPCTDDSCDETGACSFAPSNENAPCNDQDECTAGETCMQGECSGGSAQNCNDGNVCTDDSCDPAEGCVSQPNSSPCQDDSVCTLNDTCEGGQCLAGEILECDDGNVCTDDACDAKMGCIFTYNSAPCGEGLVCSQGACLCVPDCFGKECGPDGCAGFCHDSFPLCDVQTGICKGAQKSDQSCVNGQWGPCDASNYFWNNNAYQAEKESTCDNLDNDCDGKTDEELGATACGLGVCTHSVENCVDGVVQQCDPFEGEEEEVCDGEDNDCDGQKDENLGTASCGKSICFHTVDNCLNGKPQVCDPFEGAGTEKLDGIDNDCDGLIDEDFAVAGTIIITEIMANPACVPDDFGEWLELYNTTGESWDINGWILKDNDNDKITIDAGAPLVIGPGDFVVLGVDSDPFKNGGINLAYSYNVNKFQLANSVSGDEAILVGPGGVVIDEVVYSNATGFPDQNGGKGRSMSLSPQFFNHEANDTGANWHQSTAVIPTGCGDKGSPGNTND